MELLNFKQQMAGMLKKFDNTASPKSLELEGNVFKKMTDFFLAGESFYFVMNHHTMDFEFVSSEVVALLGYTPEEFTIPFTLSIIHPDDRSYFLSIGDALFEFSSKIGFNNFLNYKMRYDIRYRKKDGSYTRILYQTVILEHDNEGGILRTFGTYSDIDYIKKYGVPTLSFIGMNGYPSYINIGLDNRKFIKKRDVITSRERQILHLLASGKVSKEIGKFLEISKETVDRHRKNMIRKTNLANTSQLISKAIKEGWI